MKHKKAFIGVGIAIFMIGGYFGLPALVQYFEPPLAPVAALGSAEDQKLMHEEFPGLPESNQFSRETADEIMERFETGTGIIFLGFKQCPWCQKMVPMINQAAAEGGATIYYLDIRKLSEQAPGVYQEVMSYVAPYLPQDENGKPQVSTPDITFVRNGEVVWRYKMDTVSDAERTPDIYWTDYRKQRIKTQFSEEIKKMRQA